MKVVAPNKFITAGIYLIQEFWELSSLFFNHTSRIFTNIFDLLWFVFQFLLSVLDTRIQLIFFHWLLRPFWLILCSWEKKVFGTDVNIVSAFNHMPNLEARGDPFEFMEHNISAFEKLFKV